MPLKPNHEYHVVQSFLRPISDFDLHVSGDSPAHAG
jgi:hypothetical protein